MCIRSYCDRDLRQISYDGSRAVQFVCKSVMAHIRLPVCLSACLDPCPQACALFCSSIRCSRQSWADKAGQIRRDCAVHYHLQCTILSFSSVSLVTHSNKVALYNLSNMATLTCNVLKAPVYNLTGMQTTLGSVERKQLSMECSSSGRHTETIDCMVGQAPLMGIVVDLALTPAKMRL